jgi:hypothetical protein
MFVHSIIEVLADHVLSKGSFSISSLDAPEKRHIRHNSKKSVR